MFVILIYLFLFISEHAVVVSSEPQSNILVGPPPPLPPRNSDQTYSQTSQTQLQSRRKMNKLYENVIVKKSYDSELVSFHKMVVDIRSKFKSNDEKYNIGHVVATEQPSFSLGDTSIKLLVHPALDLINNVQNSGIKNENRLSKTSGQIDGYGTPIVFTCDINTTVEHVIMHAILVHLEGLSDENITDYILRPIGVMEWLRASSKLNQLECVRNSIMLEKDVHLALHSKNDHYLKTIARTENDDARDLQLRLEDVIMHEPCSAINYDNLMILLDCLETEIDRLISSVSDSKSYTVTSCSGVIQGIKAVCSLLGYIETLEISEAVSNLKSACESHSYSSSSAYGDATNSMDIVSENGDYAQVALRPRTFAEQIKYNCNKIRDAVEQLLDIYSNAVRVDFCVDRPQLNMPSKSIATIIQPIMVHISCLHRLPPSWKYDDYLLGTQIYHGTRYIGNAMVSECAIENIGSYPRLKFKSW